MRRGRRSSAPPAATSERLASGMPSLAPLAATIRSHASAISSPPARAKPSIAAISGLREARWVIPAKPRSPNQGDSPFTNAPRSMPAEKNPPAPVSTPTARLSSPSSSSSAPPTPAASAALTAFLTSGRLRVMSRTFPRRSASTGSEATAAWSVLMGSAEATLTGLARRARRLAHRRLATRCLPRGTELRGAVVALLQGGAELAHRLPERARQRGQALGPEDDQRDRGDEQQMNRVLDAHSRFTLPPSPSRAITSERIPTLWRRGRAVPSPGRSSLPAAGGQRIDLAGTGDGADRDRAAALAARAAHGRAHMADPRARGSAAGGAGAREPARAGARAPATARSRALPDRLGQRRQRVLAATA